MLTTVYIYSIRALAVIFCFLVLMLIFSECPPLIGVAALGFLEYLAIDRFSQQADTVWIILSIVLLTAPFISILLMVLIEFIVGKTQLGSAFGMLALSVVTIPLGLMSASLHNWTSQK